MIHRIITSILLFLFFIPVGIFAQTDPDTLKIDSAKAAPSDSSFFFFSSEPKDTIFSYDFYDSLKNRFFIENMELSGRLEKTFNHDPVDYLKFIPSQLAINYKNIPYRRTVYPLGLPGNRSNVVFDVRQLHPLGHVPAPDGKVDYDDYPILPAEYAWDIEGPLGMAFNADNAVSTLYLIPYEDLSGPAISKLHVDKGAYGFADTRGVFASRSKNGRVIKAGAQYRKVAKSQFPIDDNAYHQWAEVVYPLNDRNRLSFYGRLYRRIGHYQFRPYYGGAVLSRFRRDRDFVFAYQRDHKNGGRSTVEFRHQRSESNLENFYTDFYYKRKIDAIVDGGHIRHEKRIGSFDAQFGLHVDFLKYTDQGRDNKRRRAMVYTNLLKGDSLFAWTVYGSLEKLGGYDPGPSLMLALVGRDDDFYWEASAGYKTRFPRQYALDLEPLLADITTIDSTDYFERGNSLLDPEKQLVASFNAGLGKPGNDWQLTLTGGKILDGVDWEHYYLDTLGGTYDAYHPINHDIEFASATLLKRFSYRDNIWLYGGATYRYDKVSGNDTPDYSPDYQGFAAIQLHHYVDVIGTHFYGYLEAIMIGKYQTPPSFQSPGLTLGNQAIVNLRLSFRIKKFRFYFVSQNLLAEYYTMHDGYPITDRFAFYGLTWEFTD